MCVMHIENSDSEALSEWIYVLKNFELLKKFELKYFNRKYNFENFILRLAWTQKISMTLIKHKFCVLVVERKVFGRLLPLIARNVK